MSSSKFLSLQPGKLVGYMDNNYRISRVLSLSTVELQNEDTFELVTANVDELHSIEKNISLGQPNLVDIEESAWQLAKSRLEMIKPLLHLVVFYRMRWYII